MKKLGAFCFLLVFSCATIKSKPTDPNRFRKYAEEHDTLQEEFHATQEQTPREPASFELSNLLATEVCKPERNYFEPYIAKLPDFLNKKRAEYAVQDIPQACLLYSMRRQHRSAENDPSPFYAMCSSEKSTPKRGAYKPCVSDGYLNTIYNAYVDVMNCYGLDQKFYFPQVTWESAYHINAINAKDYDSGLTQFTKNGILNVLGNDNFNKILEKLQLSSNPACQRVVAQLGPLSIDAAEVKNRCTFLTMPKNPYLSLMFFALHHLRDETNIRLSMEKRGLFDLLAEAGWERFHRDEIVRTLSLLSYNAGVEGTLGHLEKYLRGRMQMREVVGPEHFDFTKDLNYLRGRVNKIKGKSGQFKKITFPEFLWIWHAPYMSELSYIQKHFNRVLGPICTTENFLELKGE